MKRLAYIFLLLLFTLPLAAAQYSIEDVPNVHRLDRHRFVSDPDNLLSPATRNEVDRRLDLLQDSTSAEVTYVILSSIGDRDIFRFAQDLATKWGIGKKDKNNGLLVLIVMDQRKIRIHTGYGMEGVLPDITAGRIMDEEMVPHMRNNDLDKAVSESSKRIYEILSGKENAAEVQSEMQNEEDEELSRTFHTMVMIIAFCSLFFALGILINNLVKCRRLTNYERIGIFSKSMWLLTLFTFTSLFMALPFLLIALWLRYYYRHKPIHCDTCGSVMHRLNEEEDNLHLNASQNMEEELKSVDYDVWLCDKCGTTEIFPFVNKRTIYQVCPRCHTRAAKLVKDTVTLRPTTMHKGKGIKEYHCTFCGNIHRKQYEIPKLDNSSVAAGAAAGAILGGMSRGGGGFGGGGSFGGGGFGGGGAGRGW